MECYLPLIQILEEAASSTDKDPKITIGLSPTLLSLLEDSDLKQRFPSWLEARLDLLNNVSGQQSKAATHLSNKIKNQLTHWKTCSGDLISRFADLQKSGIVDLLTCAATHGYLPLLRDCPETVRGQLKTAVKEHKRLFGVEPLGIWLPECAYYEGLDRLMIEAGLRYAVLDGHGLLHATPRPRFGLYAPICSRNGVAFFGRDSDSTLPVWSAKEGYPGDPIYREFHRDLGWDLPIDELKKIGINDSRPLGLKLHKVTNQNCPLEAKEIYEPFLASEKVKEHAKEYLCGRKTQLDRLTTTMQNKPLLVAPFDAELFGHWWFEGPSFLSELFRQATHEGVKFTHLKDVLTKSKTLQLCEPCPSSWGQGGFHDYWLNESNSWVVLEWSKAGQAMVDRCRKKISSQSQIRILQQAARELLLAQSSDWSFILRAGTTTDLARERINRHLERYWVLIRALNNAESLPQEFLKDIEKEDCLFPLVDIKDWSPKAN